MTMMPAFLSPSGNGRGASTAELAARARVRLDAALRRGLLGPVTSDVAVTGVRSIEERTYDPVVARHVVDRVPLCDPAVATYPFPDGYPPHFRRSKAFDARWLTRLSDVVAAPASGLLWLPEGVILEESVGALRRVVGWGDMLHEPLLAPRPLAGPPVVCCAPVNFFHWMTEGVPGLLAALAEEPEARVLLPPEIPRYAEDLLGLLAPERPGGWPSVRVEGVVRVPAALLPAIDPFSGFVHPDTIRLLRERFVDQLDAPGVPVAIYVSRRRAPRRALRGEEELEAQLRTRGFEIVFLEDLRLAEQMRLFARAEVVVSPHGAGLTNVLWARPGARLVEIYPANDFNDCYARLALSVGMEHRYVTAEAVPDGNGVIRTAEVLAALDA